MEDNYTILGEVKIPQEKKQELNDHVLCILNKCGIRKTKEIEIAGKPVTVLEPAKPDENGIISFDYSIFEKSKRETSTYDTNTCRLHISDNGYSYYELAIHLIMVLLEAYTNGHCYVMYKDGLMNVGGYMQLLHTILGKRIKLMNRGRCWEMMKFFHEQGNEWFFSQRLFDVISSSYIELDWEQVLACMAIEDDKIELTEEITSYQRSDIKSGNMNVVQKEKYLYYIIKKQMEEDAGRLEIFLKELLEADVERRKKMASRDDVLGTIAELSLYMISPVIVHAYALAKGTDFWEQWDEFSVSGYCDTVNERNKEEESEYRAFPFYKAIQRENEDEFLEFWDGTNLHLSEEMQHQLEEWKEDYQSIQDDPALDMEQCMAAVLTDMENLMRCRHVDAAFVVEFLEHGNEESYRKAMILIRSFMYRDVKLFPELTERQAFEWVMKYVKTTYDQKMISALISLMGNKEQRKKLFGF